MMAASTAGFESTMQQPAKPSMISGFAALKGNRQTKKVLLKSRGRIFGKRKSKEEIMKDIADMAIKGYSVRQMAETSGKSERQVQRYVDAAVKAGLLKRGDTGRIQISEQVKAEIEFLQIEMDDFIQRYPEVKNWVEDMKTRNKGKPIRNWKSLLSHLKTLCDTLELPPPAIIAGVDNVQRQDSMKNALKQFALAVQEGRVKYSDKQQSKQMGEAGFKGYVDAVRNFAMTNGVALQRGISGILSGKKVSYGKYAHVRLSAEQRDACVQWLTKKYGYDSTEVNAFIFFYLTCARNQAGVNVKVAGFETHSNGWVTVPVYESKTDTNWVKFLPADNPHQKQFVDFLARNATKGLHYLFIMGADQAKKFGNYIAGVFKECYQAVGITEEYFYKKPVHALRHVGAHYWLERLDYNHGIVCRIGGWKSVQTLIDCYGQPPAEWVMKRLTGGTGLGAAMTLPAAAF